MVRFYPFSSPPRNGAVERKSKTNSFFRSKKSSKAANVAGENIENEDATHMTELSIIPPPNFERGATISSPKEISVHQSELEYTQSLSEVRELLRRSYQGYVTERAEVKHKEKNMIKLAKRYSEMHKKVAEQEEEIKELRARLGKIENDKASDERENRMECRSPTIWAFPNNCGAFVFTLVLLLEFFVILFSTERGRGLVRQILRIY